MGEREREQWFMKLSCKSKAFCKIYEILQTKLIFVNMHQHSLLLYDFEEKKSPKYYLFIITNIHQRTKINASTAFFTR